MQSRRNRVTHSSPEDAARYQLDLMGAIAKADTENARKLILARRDPSVFVRATYVSGQLSAEPLALALQTEQPGLAELMLDAGANIWNADRWAGEGRMLTWAYLGLSRFQPWPAFFMRGAPPERKAERVAFFRRGLASRRGRELPERVDALCAELIQEGEPAEPFLAILLADPGFSGLALDHMGRRRPYREIAFTGRQHASVRWLGTGACRVAWVAAVVRAPKRAKAGPAV